MPNTIEHMPEGITSPLETAVWKEAEPLVIGLPIKTEPDVTKLIHLLAEMIKANELSQHTDASPMAKFELNTKAFNLATEARQLAEYIGIDFSKRKPKE